MRKYIIPFIIATSAALLLITSMSIEASNKRAPRALERTPVITNVPSIQAQPQKLPSNSSEVVLLTKRNTVTFRGVVTGEKVAQVQRDLMAKARQLDESETIYFVLDTPGGSIEAGNQLIDTVKSIPQPVKTITVFAASMGFQFVQNFGERLIVPSGTLMSHRAAFSGLSGQVPGELLVRLQFWLNDVERLDTIAAKRMGLSTKDYQKLIHDEYWVSGDNAVAARAADRVVLARCDETLAGTSKEFLGSFMGMKVYGEMSDCPVITGILNISVDGQGDEEAKEEALKYGAAYKNRPLFINQYLK